MHGGVEDATAAQGIAEVPVPAIKPHFPQEAAGSGGRVTGSLALPNRNSLTGSVSIRGGSAGDLGPHQVGASVMSKLWRAVTVGDVAKLEVLLVKYPLVKETVSRPRARHQDLSLLMQAASRGHWHILERLLECATDVHEASSRNGDNALHVCMPSPGPLHIRAFEDQRYLQSATRLLLAGCCPWVENAQGMTAVDLAAAQSHAGLKELLESTALYAGIFSLPLRQAFGRSTGGEVYGVVAPRIPRGGDPAAPHAYPLWMSCYRVKDRCKLVLRFSLAGSSVTHLGRKGLVLRLGAGQCAPKQLAGRQEVVLQERPSPTASELTRTPLQRLADLVAASGGYAPFTGTSSPAHDSASRWSASQRTQPPPTRQPSGASKLSMYSSSALSSLFGRASSDISCSPASGSGPTEKQAPQAQPGRQEAVESAAEDRLAEVARAPEPAESGEDASSDGLSAWVEQFMAAESAEPGADERASAEPSPRPEQAADQAFPAPARDQHRVPSRSGDSSPAATSAAREPHRLAVEAEFRAARERLQREPQGSSAWSHTVTLHSQIRQLAALVHKAEAGWQMARRQLKLGEERVRWREDEAAELATSSRKFEPAISHTCDSRQWSRISTFFWEARARYCESLEHHLCCPILREVMSDPVLLLGDGMTYERAAIAAWLEHSPTSPTTGQRLFDTTLVPNRCLKSIIDCHCKQARLREGRAAWD